MTAIERVETFLRAERASLVEQKILSSNVIVIDNLLANSLNLAPVYAAIFKQAPHGTFGTWSAHQEAWQRIFLVIIDTAAGWSPARVGESRDAVSDIADISDKINRKARELASLLRERNSHREKHCISGPMDYHPVDLIEFAAKRCGQRDAYQSWVSPRLAPIAADFGLKYWPRTADLLDALADLQLESVAPYDELSRAAMGFRQKGPLEFVRALDQALKRLATDEDISAELNHSSIADLTTAALALDEPLTRESISSARSYWRRKA